jgi:hypothetical protein
MSIPLVALAIAALTLGAALGGPAAQVSGAEPGSEKAQLIEQWQAEYEAALEATLGPVVGRPEEQWKPVLVEGIDDTAESPFEGSSFVLVNMWQSALADDGTHTQVYAGADGTRGVLTVLRSDLMTGVQLLRQEFVLPNGAGAPRLVTGDSRRLLVGSSFGRRFALDVARLRLAEMR